MMMARVLNLDRWPMMAAFLVAGTLFIPNGIGPAPVINPVPLGTVVNVMAPKPKPKANYTDPFGKPIPLDNFGNDLDYNPDVDVTDYADTNDRVAAAVARAKAKHKKD